MHPLRRLSVWGAASAAELPGADDAPRQRHRRLHHREKRYDALPLGGNRPIFTTPAADDQQRKRSRCHRRRHSPSTSSSEGSADVPATPTLHDDDPAAPSSPLEQARLRNAPTATQTAAPYPTTPEFGVYPPPLAVSPATDEREEKHSRRHAEGLQHSSGTSVQPIAVATPARRRDADGSGNSAPPTPPTPTSPLEKARLRNSYNAKQPTAPYPTEPGYVAYSPTVAVGPTIDEQEREEKHGRRRRADSSQHASSTSPTRPSQSHGQPALPSTRPNDDPLTPPTSPTSPTSPLERARQRNSHTVTQSTAPYPTTPAPAREDAFEMLARFDTALVVDDSGSMAAHWGATQRALETVARVAVQHDVDGIDLYFLNDAAHSAQRVRHADDVAQAFARVEPRGITPTAACLDAIMRPYLARLAADPTVKPLNIVVLTDGEPTDDPESVIVAAARRLDRLDAPLHQLGIQFLQIGTDASATAALHELGDALTAIHGVRDIVDTTPYADDAGGISGDVLLKALLGGVNRRLDRWG